MRFFFHDARTAHLLLVFITRITSFMVHEHDALTTVTMRSPAFRLAASASLTNRPKAVHRFSHDRNFATASCISPNLLAISDTKYLLIKYQ